MQARNSSGLSNEDLLSTKIYMRTLTDALQCAHDIAEREAAKAHYKEYVRTLVNSMKQAPMLVDTTGKPLCATDPRPLTIYKLMNFSQEVTDRYGLSSEGIKDAKDLDQRLDRAIKGLETEVALKQAHCQRLLEQIKKQEAMKV